MLFIRFSDREPAFLPYVGIFALKRLLFRKSVFTKTAYGANPIFGDVFPLSAGSDAAIRIAESFVVNVSARTNVFHIAHSLFSEISVQKTFERFAVARFVASHFVYGVVDSVET